MRSSSEVRKMAQDYNSTLNLPKTDFPMRGNLPENEPKIKEEVLDKTGDEIWDCNQWADIEKIEISQ